MKAIYNGQNFIDENGNIITEDNYNKITDLEVKGCVKVIEDEPFSNLDNLKHCKVDEGVEVIGTCTFMDLENLEDISLPDSLELIKEGAFTRCTSLKKLYIPKNVSEVCEITNDHNIEEIVVDKDNKYYDSRNNCNAIINKHYNLLENGCKNTIIPNDVEIIGDFAFTSCHGLKSIVIPESVEEIGNYAFADCTDLEKVFLHKTIQTINGSSFPDNDNFTIYYEGDSEDWDDLDFYEKDNYKVKLNYKF